MAGRLVGWSAGLDEWQSRVEGAVPARDSLLLWGVSDSTGASRAGGGTSRAQAQAPAQTQAQAQAQAQAHAHSHESRARTENFASAVPS
jgi:hypothetical protein